MSAGLFTMPTVGRTMKGLTATQVIILEAAAKSPTGSVRFGPGDRKGTRIVSRDEMGTPCIVAYCTPEHFLVGRGLLAPANSAFTFRITEAGRAALGVNAPHE